MRPGSFIDIAISAAVFTVMSGLLVSCSPAPSDGAAPTKPAAILRDVAVEESTQQVDAGMLVPTPPGPVATQPDPEPDGPAVLNAHCTACHAAAWFDQLEKSRAGLEESLLRMEAVGVRLSSAERDALLDYLTAVPEP